MKVAIATDDNFVAAHFGKCSEYTIFEVKDKKIAGKEKFNNPGHEPGLLPKLLNNKGVKCVIAGGMGPKAIGFFNDFGIKTIIGVSGEIDSVINDFIKGTLKSGLSQCNHQSESGHHICRHR